MSKRQSIARALKSMGFRKDENWPNGMSSDSGAVHTLFYLKDVGPRTLDLQLEKDGTGRVSHYLYTDHPSPRRRGCMNTPPSLFNNLVQLIDAVKHEEERTDHPPRGIP